MTTSPGKHLNNGLLGPLCRTGRGVTLEAIGDALGVVALFAFAIWLWVTLP